jgi:hypothetical protein
VSWWTEFTDALAGRWPRQARENVTREKGAVLSLHVTYDELPRSPRNPVTTFAWIVVGITGWLAIAVAVGLMFRGRNHHYPRPSPNHPAGRRLYTPGRELTAQETATLAKMREQLTQDEQTT